MQARETIHIAVELHDRYYLEKSQKLSLDDFKANFMQANQVIKHQIVFMLLSSKLNECDDNITLMGDLVLFVKSQLERKMLLDPELIPTYDQVIECERQILYHFDWNINFILPINFLRLHLAQGILFTSELKPYQAKLRSQEYHRLKQELLRALTVEALTLSDIISAKGALFLRETDPSNIAASIIFFARKNILLSEDVADIVKVPSLWPEELI